MNKILTKCKVHGELTIENCKKIKKRNWQGYRCNICTKHQKTKSYLESNSYKKNPRLSYEERYNKFRNRYLLSKFNITLIDYNKILSKQEYKCAICKKKESANSSFKKNIKNLAVDHCHKTNKIRGILCHKCNMLLGYANDSVEILQSTIKYLQSV